MASLLRQREADDVAGLAILPEIGLDMSHLPTPRKAR